MQAGCWFYGHNDGKEEASNGGHWRADPGQARRCRQLVFI